MKQGEEPWSKYGFREKELAVNRLLESGKSVNAFVDDQGWPSHTLMYQWIRELAFGSQKNVFQRAC